MIAPHITCPGHCCAVLHIRLDPLQLQDMADILIDGDQITTMVTPLDVDDARARHDATGTQATFDESPSHYACKHWDPTTQLCGNYHDRPAICRDYPYAKACQHCGLIDGITPAERLTLARHSDRS